MATKNCFIDKDRPCDLTCKAAMPVDDVVEPVDCYFVWLADHLGQGVFDFGKVLQERVADLGAGPGDAGPGSGPGPDSGGISPN